MKNRPLPLAAALASLLLLVGFTNQAKPAQPQFEYKIEYGLKEKKLNSLASEGWELVAVGPENVAGTVISAYVLKRAKP